ncbi:hypothetical protein PAESOLCIP111_04790 [Paenibacillus solanacearum]|uniref:F5/8 type C domain-containing protein n=1 Tax=Paenibacillus solanacearum TaxID=2048548 RepID=A0A916K4X8_9BACL|nr:discoidin domain-containing protein [Paenibacillus solanacearum]CAG7644737.1 hypothetical protein PAESOLCIP111_04790 [Paenibacillus solanacearum]
MPKLHVQLKRSMAGALALCMIAIAPQSALAWGGVGTRNASLTNSNSSGHGKITMDAYNDSRASAFKTYMNSIPDTGYGTMSSRLLRFVAEADVADEKKWVAELDDAGNPDVPIAISISENATNDSVIHLAGHAVTSMKNDVRLHNATEMLRVAIYWKKLNQKPELQFRLLANGVHLAQDYFAHLNGGRDSGMPHGINSALKVDDNGDGIAESAVGDGNVMDSLNWDNHSDHNSGLPYVLRIADAFNVSYWHKDTNWNNNYRYKQSKELSISYFNAFMSETEADFVKSLEQGFVVNGSTTTYINFFGKVVVDNTDSSFAAFDSAWSASTSGSGYWGTNYAVDGTSGADASTRWAKFSTPDSSSWYTFRPGRYDIYMRWPAGADRPDAAPLEIAYNGGVDTTKSVNQKVNGGQWNLIGNYNLAATGGYVKLLATDAGNTAADAVMFVKTADNFPIASAAYSSSHEGSGWTFANMYDGIRSSVSGKLGWSSQNNTSANHTEWFTADLGSAKTISRVDLYPRNDATRVGDCFPIDFTIEVSADNVNWTTVSTKTNYAKPGNQAQSFTFAPQSARYVKINGTNLRTDQYGAYRMQFAEIEVF